MASLILVRNVVVELRPKRTLAASRGFLAAARLSCLALNVNISKTVRDESKVAMRFRLTTRSMTLDDTDLLQLRIRSQFSRISQIWKITTTKRTKIDPYYLQRY